MQTLLSHGGGHRRSLIECIVHGMCKFVVEGADCFLFRLLGRENMFLLLPVNLNDLAEKMNNNVILTDISLRSAE